MNRIALACLLVSTVLLAACPIEHEQTPEETLTPEETVLVGVGDAAPDFELVTLEGESFSLQEHRGKVVLVNFFATWCPPCREELPYLEKEIWKRFDPERQERMRGALERVAAQASLSPDVAEIVSNALK